MLPPCEFTHHEEKSAYRRRKNLLTAWRKNSLPCREKSAYRARKKTLYRMVAKTPYHPQNLSKDAVTPLGVYGSEGFNIDVRVRNFRENSSTGGVKTPGLQSTIPIGELASQIYQMHMKRYTSPNTEECLFVDTRGNPMTLSTYEKRFQRVKKAFIQTLMESQYVNNISYGAMLQQRRWRSHIGRGTFSNLISGMTNNAAVVAAARRDSDVTSCLPYLNDVGKLFYEIGMILQKNSEEQ